VISNVAAATAATAILPESRSSMPVPDPSPSSGTGLRPNSSRVLTWWFGLMSIGGLVFGTQSERRPFGTDVLAHPVVIFFAVVGVGLLVLRAALRRPVPDIISDRMLYAGCAIGLLAFLIGNWFAIHLAAM
jgi:hypothetical protein